MDDPCKGICARTMNGCLCRLNGFVMWMNVHTYVRILDESSQYVLCVDCVQGYLWLGVEASSSPSLHCYDNLATHISYSATRVTYCN